MSIRLRMADSLTNDKGKCSNCSYLSGRSYENGKEVLVCLAFKVEINRKIAECTQYSRKEAPHLQGQNWEIYETENGEIFWETPQGRYYRRINGKLVKVRNDGSEFPKETKQSFQQVEPAQLN